MHTKHSLLIGFMLLAISGAFAAPLAAYADTASTTASSTVSAISFPFNGMNPGPAVCVGGMTTNIITDQPCATASSTDATSSPITTYNPWRSYHHELTTASTPWRLYQSHGHRFYRTFRANAADVP